MEPSSDTIGLTSVLWSKFVSYVAGHSLREIARDFIISVSVSFAVGMLAKPGTTAFLIRWQGGIIPLTVLLLTAFVHAKWLAMNLWQIALSLVPEGGPSEGETIEGIPTVELLDHLFTARSLKVKEATAKFSVPQHRVEILVKRLKEIGVLAPGANNSSVLNPAMSRQDVASILQGRDGAKDLQPLFRKKDFYLTSEPSASEIETRVEAALTPPLRSPGFASRELAAAS